LDGRDPLGFLCALGLLRLLGASGGENTERGAAAGLRLSFSYETRTAILHSRFPSVDAVAETLMSKVASADADAAIIGVHPEFPLHRKSKSDAKADDGDGDPMRVPRERFGDLRAKVADLRDPAASRWLRTLVTDLAVDRAGRAALSPYM